MKHRTGEKIGWIGGWFGSFCWLLLLGILLLARDAMFPGGLSVLLFIVAMLVVWFASPWRLPRIRMIWLMLPHYLLLVAGVWIVMDAHAVLGEPKPSPWLWLIFLPMMTPLFILGGRCWSDGEEGGD